MVPGALHTVPSLGPTACVVVLQCADGGAPEGEAPERESTGGEAAESAGASVIVTPLYSLPDPARATTLDFCLRAEDTPDHVPRSAALWNTRSVLVADLGPTVGDLPPDTLEALQTMVHAAIYTDAPLDHPRLGRGTLTADVFIQRHQEQVRYQALTGRVLDFDRRPDPVMSHLTTSTTPPPTRSTTPPARERDATGDGALDSTDALADATADATALLALRHAPTPDAWHRQALALLDQRTTRLSPTIDQALFVETPPVPVYLPMRQSVALTYLRGPRRSVAGDLAVLAWWTQSTTGRAPSAIDRRIARALHGRTGRTGRGPRPGPVLGS